MNNLYKNEKNYELLKNLISKYSLNSEVEEYFKKIIIENNEKYNIETTDNYISEMIQSCFEVLKNKIDFQKNFNNFYISIWNELFEENNINQNNINGYIQSKRAELEKFIENIIQCLNEVSYSINKIQNDEINEYFQRFELVTFENYDLLKNKILDMFNSNFGSLISNGLNENEVNRVIINFKNELESLYWESNLFDQYKNAIKEFDIDYYRNGREYSYNTNIEEKIERIKKIIREMKKSIDSIEEYGYKDKLVPEIVEKLYKIREKININDVQNFGEINEIINEYKEIVCEIWKDYLNNVDKWDGEMRYLIHNIGSREYYGEFKYPVISTSLITNKHIAFYQQFVKGIPNGFIISPKKIVSAGYFDNSINNTVGGNMNSGMYQIFQLPYELEYDSIKEVKKQDGEILSYLNGKYNSDCCNEIACNDFDIIGYFFMSFGEGELNPVYNKSKRMADARNIELEEIDFVKLRVQNGLSPMTDYMKRELLKNILMVKSCRENSKDMKYMSDFEYRIDLGKEANEREEFIEKNFERFANRYLSIKNSSDFGTQSILEQLRYTILDYECEKYQEDNDYVIGQGVFAKLYIGELKDAEKEYINSIIPEYNNKKSVEEALGIKSPFNSMNDSIEIFSGELLRRR